MFPPSPSTSPSVLTLDLVVQPGEKDQLPHPLGSGPFPAWPSLAGQLLPLQRGGDIILLAFCASKNSVDLHGPAGTGSKVMTAKGPEAGRAWEPQGGDEPGLLLFWVEEVLGFGPVSECPESPLAGCLMWVTASQVHPRAVPGMESGRDRTDRRENGAVGEREGAALAWPVAAGTPRAQPWSPSSQGGLSVAGWCTVGLS